MELEKKIKLTLDRIRPYIQGDGGDIEFVSYNEETGVVIVKLLGACIGCSLVDFTIKGGVEALLMDEIPEVRAVITEDTYLY
jgi:Fe-S cluster biogenesis protein NfuA